MKNPLASKLSSREKNILGVTIVLLVFTAGYYGVWTPLQNKFSDMEEQVFSLELKLRKAKVFLRQRDQVLEESKKYPNLTQMDAGSDQEEITKLLDLIAETARKAGVSLSDVKPQSVGADKSTKRYVVELNAESDIQQLIQFAYDLQHSPQLLKVEQVNTSPKEDKSPTLRSFLVVTRVVVK